MIDKLENKKCDVTTEHTLLCTIYMIFLYKMENFIIQAVVLYEYRALGVLKNNRENIRISKFKGNYRIL